MGLGRRSDAPRCPSRPATRGCLPSATSAPDRPNESRPRSARARPRFARSTPTWRSIVRPDCDRATGSAPPIRRGNECFRPEGKDFPLARPQFGHDWTEWPAGRLPDPHPIKRLDDGKVDPAERALAELGGDGRRDRDDAVPKPQEIEESDLVELLDWRDIADDLRHAERRRASPLPSCERPPRRSRRASRAGAPGRSLRGLSHHSHQGEALTCGDALSRF
jgi:hypothetical protein